MNNKDKEEFKIWFDYVKDYEMNIIIPSYFYLQLSFKFPGFADWIDSYIGNVMRPPAPKKQEK